MAMTNAEKVRRYQERKKAAFREAIANGLGTSASYAKRPFSEFIGDRTLELDENLDAFGVRLMGGDFLTQEPHEFPTQRDHEEPVTALHRAVGLVDAFIDAARELSEFVNAYKLEEIDNRIAEIEQSDLSDPAVKKQALADIVRLNELRKRLDRDVRHTFREVRAEGE